MQPWNRRLERQYCRRRPSAVAAFAGPLSARSAQQIGRKHNIGNAGICHHLSLSQLLAGNPMRPSRNLQFCQHWGFMRLDVGAVGQCHCVSVLLSFYDVTCNHIEIDHCTGCTKSLDDCGLERGNLFCHFPTFSYACQFERTGLTSGLIALLKGVFWCCASVNLCII